MKARIVKTGNSRAVIIPASVASELGWEVGDEIELEPMAEGVALTRSSGKRRSISAIGRRILRESADVFRELAKR